jgi:hypothetical protein
LNYLIFEIRNHAKVHEIIIFLSPQPDKKEQHEKKDVSTAILDKKKAPNRLLAEEAL